MAVQELADLESKIGPRISFFAENINPENKPLIRRWLLLMGTQERKILTASDYVLANAYRAGKPYINKMNSEDSEKRFGKNRRGALKIDLGAELSPQVNNLLDEKIIETPDDSIFPFPDPSPDFIDQAQLERLIKALIKPEVGGIERRLSAEMLKSCVQTIDYKFDAALKSASIGDALREQILSLVTTTALDLITKSIPRKLELHTPNQPVRVLDAEPRHKIFDEVLSLLSTGEHVYIVGNAGTGKTHMFKQLAKALDRPVTILGQALTKYEFSGHIGPTGEYVKTLLRTAVEEGHLLAIDEIDMSAAAAIGFLNSLTANRYVAFPDKMVDAHPNFIVIAAANTYGRGATSGFIGRNPLDAASLDRFSYVECPYDENLERQIYGASDWLNYVHRVRGAIETLKQQHIVSMRAIERGLRCITLGMTPERVCEVALWRGLAPDTISKIKNLAGEFKPRNQIREVA